VSAAQQAVLPAAGSRMMRLLIDAGVPVLAGTDAPTFCLLPGESLMTELQLLGAAGLPPLSVLQSATRTPAQRLGQGDRFGAVVVGHAADLVLLAANPLTDVGAYAHPVGVYTQRRWHDTAGLAALRHR